MLSMSGALGAASATSYFKEEFEHARGNYYAEEDRTVGQWRGELAEHFGLSGGVSREDFERLCEGQDPRTGEQLVRHVRPHERTNQYGDEIETGGHRAGCDITFSAPKSVSLAALVGGDEAHQGGARRGRHRGPARGREIHPGEARRQREGRADGETPIRQLRTRRRAPGQEGWLRRA